jgi:hypothetical protein
VRRKLLILREVVGAKGFEPSTSWSRTRFQALLKSMKFCGSERIENKRVTAGLLKPIEASVCGGARSYRIIYIHHTQFGLPP